MEKIFLKKLDKVIIILVLLVGILPAGIVILSNISKPSNSIVIKVDNKVVKEAPLYSSSDSKIYNFSFEKGIGYIEVKGGKVRMLEMSKKICPNAICSDTGWISKSYQSIVCLPNHITVTFGMTQKEEVDDESF